MIKHASKIAGALIAAAILATPVLAQDNLATWAKYKDVAINTKATGADVTADVANFPVLVRLDATNANDVFEDALADGADIRFADADGAQRPFEIEHWDAVNKTAAIWVLADTVQGNDSVVSLRMYWDKSTASSASGTSVFDTSLGYVGVWGLSRGTGTERAASVPGAPTAVVRNGLPSVQGVIGLADTLGPINPPLSGTLTNGRNPDAGRYIEFGRNLAYANNDYAGFGDFSAGVYYSLWINPAACNANAFHRLWVSAVDSTGSAANNADNVLFMASSGTAGCNVALRGITTFNSTAAFAANQWSHVAISRTSGTGDVTIYVNGVPFDTAASTTAFSTQTAPNFRNYTFLGRSTWGDAETNGPTTNGNPYFAGKVDQVTLAKQGRSPEFVKLSYETQKAAASAVTLGATQTQTVAAMPYDDWSGHKTITTNTKASGANIPANVYNFPVLVRLGSAESAILTAANSDGSDIRFSKMDDSTALPYQIESWSATAAAIWVKLDTVKGNDSLAAFRMHYGNDEAVSESSGPAVFDTANGFVAVWHMNDDGDQMDATGNGNTATESEAAPADTTGLMGGAKKFNGTTNWYQVGTDNNAVNLNTNDAGVTISAWVNPASCDERIAAFSKYVNGDAPPGRQYSLHTGNTPSNWRFTLAPSVLNGASGTEFFADAENTCVTGTWKHVVGAYASAGTATADSAVNVKIYVDGVLMGSGGTAGVSGVGDSAIPYIGRIHNDQRYMNGSIDEITVSAVRRDSNWIKLSYESQKLMQAFTNVGVTLPSVPTAPQAVTAIGAGTVGAVSIYWSAPASNGGANISGYTVTANPGTGTCSTTGALTCNITGLTAGSYTFTVTATNSAGTSPASAAASYTVVGLALPEAFTIHMNGASKPYTYRLPTNVIALTEKLSMTITDVQGKQVWTRTINPASAKIGEITWNGKTAQGQAVAPGMYIVRLRAQFDGKVIEAVRGSVKN